MRKKKCIDYNKAESIKTQRLIMTPVNQNDTEEIFRELTFDVTRYMLSAPTQNMKDAIKVVNKYIKYMKRGEACVYSIRTVDGEFLGLGSIYMLDTLTPEFGVWIKKTAQSHGYGREVAQGMYDTYSTHYAKFIIMADDHNYPSRKIAVSLGGVTDGEIRTLKGSGDKELRVLMYEIDGKSEK